MLLSRFDFKINKLLIIPFCLFALAACDQSDDEIDSFESSSSDALNVGSDQVCKGVVSTKTSPLNVRTSPSINNNVCAQLEPEAPVMVSLEGAENGFLKIQSSECNFNNNEWAYVSEKFVTLSQDCFEKPEVPVAPKTCDGTVATQTSPLNVRLAPQSGNNICAKLNPNASVVISQEGPIDGYLKIKSSDCNSAADAWAYVSEKFIAVKSNCSFEDNREPASVISSITNFGNYIIKELTRISTRRPLTRSSAEGPVEVYKIPGKGSDSICGVKHIRNNRSEGHLAKDSLCAWTAVAQEWRQKYCKENSSHCRIMQGDTTFGLRQPASWPHASHRRGWCMDIWPMRKSGCGEQELTWKSNCYDRVATQNLVQLLIKHGADKGNQFFFNDPQIVETRRLSNHDDHIHVCFKPTNSIVQKSCDKLTVDRKLCPEF